MEMEMIQEYLLKTNAFFSSVPVYAFIEESDKNYLYFQNSHAIPPMFPGNTPKRRPISDGTLGLSLRSILLALGVK